MLDASLVRTLNVNISILPFAVEVSEQLAERFDHLLDHRTQLEDAVALLTTSLIHKSFVNTLCGLKRAAEVRGDLERLQRADDVAHLDAIVSRFIAELYTYKSLDLTGREISSNTAEVEDLFAEVCRLLSDTSAQEDSERVMKDLRVLKDRFVAAVVETVRDRTADLRTTGLGSAHPEVEKRLHRLESHNFEDLVQDYELMATGRSDNRIPLPDIAYKHQTQIENAVRLKLRARVVKFIEQDTNEQGNKAVLGRFKKWFHAYFGIGPHDLKAAYVSETEHFLLYVREAISRSQRLIILRSALDKVHMFYGVLDCISNSVQAAQRRTKASIAKLQESEANEEAMSLRGREDLISDMIATAYEATAKLSRDHAEREKGHEVALVGTANHLKDLIDMFDLRNQHNTECLVALSDLANYMRVYHPTLVNETGEPAAPQTTRMAARILDTLDKIAESQERYFKNSQKQ